MIEHELPQRQSRRQLLQQAGLLGLGTIVAGGGARRLLAAATRSVVAPRQRALVHPRAAPFHALGPAACTLTPQQTEGPYYFNAALLRRDITEGRPGDSQSGIQVALSQGERLTVPGVPTLPGVAHVQSHAAFGARVAYGPWSGGVVAQFEY